MYVAKDGFEGLNSFNSIQPHLIILDIMMPGINGFEVLEEIRKISKVPVVMLTAKQEEVDKLKGFSFGVDDYVSKPFSPKELVARAQAIINRTYSSFDEKKILIFKELSLDLNQHKLYKNGQSVDISSKEFALIQVFFRHQGMVLTREQLIEDAFGIEYEGFDRNIDSFIKKLRAKIGTDSKQNSYIKTKYGAGYIFGGD